MRIPTRLLFLAAFIVLALPMVMMAGTAQAAAPFLLDDGARLNNSGQWEVIDPGVCRSNGAQTTRSACNAELFPAFTTQSTCEGTAFCTNVTYTTAADCINNGYVWTFVRKWNVSNCIGNYTSDRTYGATANACSNASYAILTDCTTNGGTWQTINNNVASLNESQRVQCLHCHNDAYGTHSLASFGNGSSQETYFLTGHKNVLRPVRNLGADVDTAATYGSAMKPLGGPNYTAGEPSTSAYTNINWATGMATTTNVYYIYNGWFSSIKVNQIEGDPTPDAASASTVANNSGARNCFFCHTSAYNLPEARYPLAGETWTAAVTSTAALAKFEIGTTCVACHKGAGNNWGDYGIEHHTSTGTNNYANYPAFEEGTALCSNCHRLEDTGGPITDIAIQEDALLVEELEDHHGNITGQFLQSPHAKFTGTYGSIMDPSKYLSNFKLPGGACDDPEWHTLTGCTTNGGTWNTETEHNMGCQECHNPHVSGVDPDTRDTTTAQTHLTNYCVSCHTNGTDEFGTPQIDITTINHPSGVGTPLGGGSVGNEKEVQMACIRCHMSDRVNHLFEINTDANYETFNSLCADPQYETRTTCTGAGQIWSDMAKEFGDINADPENAVFAKLNVNWACGWCHTGSYAAEKGAPVFSKAALASYAANMHNTHPVANFTTNVDYSASYTLNFSAASSTCPGGSCTYEWDFDNDGQTDDGTGSAIIHTFAGVGPYPVTLKVTTSGNVSASITKNVSPVAINAAPVVCSENVTQSGKTVTFDDCSTDDGSATVYVNWGDGQPVQAFTLSQNAISHTYAVNGTYIITHRVKDSAGLKDVETLTRTVPLKGKATVTVLGDGTGEVGGTPLLNALVRVYNNGVLKAQGYTNAGGTFVSAAVVEPSLVTVTATKTGKTIVCGVPAYAGANTTVACTY